MVDNVTLNPGVGGDDIATEDVAGVEYQKVKLVDGTATSTTAIPLSGDLANGLDVDVTRVGGTVTVDGSGVTQPVSGTVTANLSATDNAVLDSIAAAQLPDGHNVTVDNASLTVDLGANNDVTVTSGTITANLGATDNAVLDTIAASNAAIQTAVEILDNAIAGSEMQVDIVSGGTGSTQYAEDTAHTTGDTGTMSLAVRNDTLAALAGTDGDYSPLQVNASGSLYVEVENLGGTSNVDSVAGATDSGAVMLAIRDDSLTTLTPVDGDYVGLRTNSTGALHVTGGGGGTEYTEDAAAPANPVGTAFVMERDDALGGITPIAGDWSHPFCSANGALWTTVDGTVTVDGSGVTQPVSGTVTANLSATDNAVLDTIDAVLDTINAKLVTGTVIGDVNLGATDNAVLDSIVTNTTGLAGTVSGSELQVDVVAALPAGTNGIGKLTANSGVDIGDVDVTSISAGANLVGDVGLSGARTSGGTTLYKNIDVDESEDAVKASAGQVYWIHAINTNAALRYLKFYNATVGTVVVGTTVPDLTFPVPASTTGAGFTLSIPNGIAFGTAITIAATTGVADADSGAPGANEVIVNLGYA